MLQVRQAIQNLTISPRMRSMRLLGQETTERYLPSEAEPYPQVSARRGEETALV